MALLDEPQGYIDEKSVSFMPTVLKWGGISAAFSIIYTLVQNMMGSSSMFSATGIILGLAALVIGIYIFVRAVREHRDQQLGGFISFGRAFVIVLLTVIVSTLASTVFNYVYLNFINPSAIDSTLESITAMYEKMGLSEEIIEQSVEQQRAALASPMSILTGGLLGGGFGGAITGSIMAAIMKRERPKFT